MARIKWTDRRFDFSFPLELYPELLERLRGTPARVTERLEHVAPELRVRRPGQAWSIQEHAGHLADLDESLFLPRVEEYLLGVDRLRAADMTNRATAAAQVGPGGVTHEDDVRPSRAGAVTSSPACS